MNHGNLEGRVLLLEMYPAGLKFGNSQNPRAGKWVADVIWESLLAFSDCAPQVSASETLFLKLQSFCSIATYLPELLEAISGSVKFPRLQLAIPRVGIEAAWKFTDQLIPHA